MFDYSLALRTSRSAAEVRSFVRSVTGGEPDGDETWVDALAIRVDDVDHPVVAQTLGDLLGMRATTDVWFGIQKNPAEADGCARELMLTTAARPAEFADAEACLTFQLDRVLVRRVAGELVLYDWVPEWADPVVVAALVGPWTLTSDDGELD
jgi:hypothetical protein